MFDVNVVDLECTNNHNTLTVDSFRVIANDDIETVYHNDLQAYGAWLVFKTLTQEVQNTNFNKVISDYLSGLCGLGKGFPLKKNLYLEEPYAKLLYLNGFNVPVYDENTGMAKFRHPMMTKLSVQQLKNLLERSITPVGMSRISNTGEEYVSLRMMTVVLNVLNAIYRSHRHVSEHNGNDLNFYTYLKAHAGQLISKLRKNYAMDLEVLINGALKAVALRIKETHIDITLWIPVSNYANALQILSSIYTTSPFRFKNVELA